MHLNTNPTVASAAPAAQVMWIGMSDALIVGSWAWSDDTPVLYNNFGAIDFHSSVHASLNCAAVSFDRGQQWGDRACSEAHPYLCKTLNYGGTAMPPSPPPSPPSTVFGEP